MFAFLTINPERVTALFTGLLSVVGGYLAGFVLAMAAAFFLDRWLMKGRSPRGLHRAARHVGGVCGAVLVAFIVFGSGLGTGGGDGAGSGPEGQTTTAPAPTATPALNPAELIPDAPPPEDPAETVVQVTVLSGADVRSERFYLVDTDRTPRTLAEVKDQITARRSPGRTAAVAIRLAPRTDRQNSGVRDLEQWATDAGLRVILPRKE